MYYAKSRQENLSGLKYFSWKRTRVSATMPSLFLKIVLIMKYFWEMSLNVICVLNFAYFLKGNNFKKAISLSNISNFKKAISLIFKKAISL